MTNKFKITMASSLAAIAMAFPAAGQDTVSFEGFALNEAGTAGLTALNAALGSVQMGSAGERASYTKDGTAVEATGERRRGVSIAPAPGLSNSNVALSGLGDANSTTLVAPIAIVRPTAVAGAVDDGTQVVAVPNRPQMVAGVLALGGTTALEAEKVGSVDLDRAGLGGFMVRGFGNGRGQVTIGATVGQLEGQSLVGEQITTISAEEVMASASVRYDVAQFGRMTLAAVGSASTSRVSGEAVSAKGEVEALSASLSQVGLGAEIAMPVGAGRLALRVAGEAVDGQGTLQIGACDVAEEEVKEETKSESKSEAKSESIEAERTRAPAAEKEAETPVRETETGGTKEETADTCQTFAPVSGLSPMVGVSYDTANLHLGASVSGLGTAREETRLEASLIRRF